MYPHCSVCKNLIYFYSIFSKTFGKIAIRANSSNTLVAFNIAAKLLTSSKAAHDDAVTA